jgi:PEGA domain
VPPPSGGGGNIYPYYPWGFWGPGYGFGLGYLYYDPWYGGYGYGYPGGYGDDFGYGGYSGGGYSGGGGGYGVSQSYRDNGSLRLKIDPKQAQVYIDGYYVGLVDSFDGAFQKLGIEGGGHRVELKAEGYEPLQFEVLITPGETVTYKGEMKRIK